MNAPRTKRILFVCMGNICRSPTAEGVMRAQLQAVGLQHVEVDSAGTHGWHAGEPPDPRSQQHAAQRGYDLSKLRARQLVAEDFERFDWVLVMDEANLQAAARLCPPTHRAKLHKLLGAADVPDPYHGGAQGFEQVLDLVEAACERWLERLR
ncbi:MAG: low molecular weight phosphotyrosine protein phosphatase [Burkholderiales bacterium]|uniref:low molecular weight protein-tyrosine-phosphatase n=1 Tax=Inhella sp. TaxID=1921806 RepID=UPI001AC4C5C6|nr:low molecular weight phosphotyrosine protein phosphatase [Burkholderiales bacterium]